jgi:kinesin family protein 5
MFVPGCGLRPFHFPTVCDDKAPQHEVYQRVAQDAVCSALNGMNACVLAYGQTGSGKTHTVFGPPGVIDAACHAADNADWRVPSAAGLAAASVLPPTSGLVLRACEELLGCVHRPGASCGTLSLSAQYIQIYDESLIDLISGSRDLRLRELGDYAEYAPDGTTNGGAVLQGATQVKLTTLSDALALLRAGELHKQVAATAMNETSSRAHTIFLVTLTQRRTRAIGSEEDEAEESVLSSQLALVDLAGSEQLKQSKAAGQRMREAVGINSSLLVLGKCITALSEGKRHVPYHESKLTKLLRGAFGGSSRTTCVIAASPDDAHGENTVQALRFGERCATITNSAKISAVSAAQALSVVDNALNGCEQSMANLEAKGRTGLPAYATGRARHASRVMRRQQLAAA